MNILSGMDTLDSGDNPNFNTGTLFDLATGKYVQGIDGEWYLTGGLPMHITVFGGRNGHFKSTICNAFGQRIAAVYPDSDLIIEDTEDSLTKDKDRAYAMAEELAPQINRDNTQWLKGIDYDLDSFDSWFKDYCIKKEAVGKDLMVDTPFFDEKTHQPIKVMVPTLMMMDSITELVTAVEEDMVNGEKTQGIGDPKNNTVAMVDGNKKTLWIRTMRRRCQKYGIIFIGTGHYDKILEMDPYSPTPKETIVGKQSWKLKRCGSNLKFLASIYAITNASLLVDSNKEPLYDDGSSASKDIFQVDVTLERCKTSCSGTTTPFVASQTKGFLNAVTNYHYLRLNNYFGLNGNKQKQQPFLMPDTTISRNTVRQIAGSSPQVRRALELAAQYCFIKNNWNTKDLHVDFNMEPAKVFDLLNSDKKKTLVQDILNTRGYWTYGACEIPYMSVIRMLELVKQG